MAERKIPRAEDVFKNKKAPPPPAGVLPKIGNYTPKSLMAPTPGGDTQEKTDISPIFEDDTPTPVPNLLHVYESKPRPIMMGDKDTPLKVDQDESDTMPVPAPRRKRKAPSVPDIGLERAQVSDNPLFGRSVSNISDDDTIDEFEEQGGVIDFGLGSGLAYDQKSNDYSNVSVAGTIDPDYEDKYVNDDFGIGVDDEPISPRTRNTPQTQDPDMPYIPPPDYDDEEMTFNFDDEGKQVFKEYAGEDFGKYLNEDEDYRVQQDQRRQSGAPRRTTPHILGGPRRPNNPNIQGKKYKKKKKGPDVVQKRNTLRDFNFSDTKIGWGDRTVKSTSAKGRYIKREKERNKVDTTTVFNRPQSQGPSYEDFLLGKKDLDSPNSSDSGVDTGEVHMRRNSTGAKGESNRGYVPDGLHERAQSEIFYHSQPKQMRSNIDNHDHHKASLWKRLTWRFKKSVNISKMGGR